MEVNWVLALDFLYMAIESARVSVVVVWLESNKFHNLLVTNLILCVCAILLAAIRVCSECTHLTRLENEGYNEKFRVGDRLRKIIYLTAGQLGFDLLSLPMASVGVAGSNLSDAIAILLIILTGISVLINMARIFLSLMPVPVNYEKISL